MYYNSRKKLRFVAFICVLVIIWCIVFVIDYLRVSNDRAPIFVVKTVQHENGTKEMYGVLYKVNMYIKDGTPKYEIGFINLEYDANKFVDVYVEPYKEYESLLQN